MEDKLLVGILLGSDSDFERIEGALTQLDEFGIRWEIRVLSAHRSPHDVHKYVLAAKERGLKVIIAAAGMAAHLAGTVAALTTLPVIGVPMPGSSLGGTDALYATVQMPTGVPVATMAIGSAGAKNAAIFAAQVLALNDPALDRRIEDHKRRLADEVREKDRQVQERVKKKA